MKNYIEGEIVVRAMHGMQLSEGYIRTDNQKIIGCLPGIISCLGKTGEDVRTRLEQEARKYYGDDVIVELILSHAMVS